MPATSDPARLLRDPWRALRRRVLLHRRGLAALLLAAGVAAGLASVRAPAEATTAVWAAAHDLSGDSPLGEGDLRRVRVPSDAVPAGALGYAALLGRLPAGPMRSGEPFTDRRLLDDGLLDAYPGRVAVPVRLADPGASRLLRAGDRVDLMRMDPQGDEPAALLASHAAVLAVLPSDDEGGLSGPSGAGGLVLVAVAEDVSPEVAGAGASGFLTVALPG